MMCLFCGSINPHTKAPSEACITYLKSEIAHQAALIESIRLIAGSWRNDMLQQMQNRVRELSNELAGVEERFEWLWARRSNREEEPTT